MRTRLFKSGNSLAVRIPKGLHFDAPAEEVEIERVGDTLVVRPVGPRLTNVLKRFAAFSPGFMSRGREPSGERDRVGW
jgi:antitoxin VapB